MSKIKREIEKIAISSQKIEDEVLSAIELAQGYIAENKLSDAQAVLRLADSLSLLIVALRLNALNLITEKKK